METMTVKPAPGRTVPDPRTREPIPAEGKEVPRTNYWVRRLRDGDVEEVSTSASRRRKGRHLKAVPNPKDDGKDGDQ